MKNLLKSLLLKTGFFYSVSFKNSIPKIIKWIKLGCRAHAPHPVKMAIIKSYLTSYKLNSFVETGTFMGDTLGYIAASGSTCYSIELSDEFYNKAVKRFGGQKNIHLIMGDSGVELPKLVTGITEPTLFWLDGHYSAANTATAEYHTPVSIEVSAILSHHIKSHVILIDDAKCFDGTDNYPFLDELLLFIRKDGNYSAEVSTDIIRLVPLR